MKKNVRGSAAFLKRPIRIIATSAVAAAFILVYLVYASSSLTSSLANNIRRYRRVAKAAYLYQDVARSDDDTLFMAYYFPQYHIAPENVLQFHAYGMNVSGEDAKYYTDWDVVKKSQGFRSFTPQTYYNLADSSVYDVQDELASRYGVGVFIFYHYWLDNTMVLNLPVDLFMQKRRKTKFLLCWDNESGFLGKQIYGSPEKHGYQLLRYFLNDNYLTDKHGRKPFIVYLTEGLDVGYLRKLLAFLESNGINLKVGSNFQKYKNMFALPPWSTIASEFAPHSEGGAQRVNLYNYTIQDPKMPAGSEYWQGAITSWDSRPRCSSGRTHQKNCGGNEPNGQVSSDGFRKLLEAVKANFHHLNQDHVITIFAWNEWAEGAALETSVEFGHMFLEQLRLSVMV